MKEIKIKTILLSSYKEENLECFINEFSKICNENNLKFKDICDIFDKIIIFSDNND